MSDVTMADVMSVVAVLSQRLADVEDLIAHVPQVRERLKWREQESIQLRANALSAMSPSDAATELQAEPFTRFRPLVAGMGDSAIAVALAADSVLRDRIVAAMDSQITRDRFRVEALAASGELPHHVRIEPAPARGLTPKYGDRRIEVPLVVAGRMEAVGLELDVRRSNDPRLPDRAWFLRPTIGMRRVFTLDQWREIAAVDAELVGAINAGHLTLTECDASEDKALAVNQMRDRRDSSARSSQYNALESHRYNLSKSGMPATTI